MFFNSKSLTNVEVLEDEDKSRNKWQNWPLSLQVQLENTFSEPSYLFNLSCFGLDTI